MYSAIFVFCLPWVTSTFLSFPPQHNTHRTLMTLMIFLLPSCFYISPFSSLHSTHTHIYEYHLMFSSLFLSASCTFPSHRNNIPTAVTHNTHTIAIFLPTRDQEPSGAPAAALPGRPSGETQRHQQAAEAAAETHLLHQRQVTHVLQAVLTLLLHSVLKCRAHTTPAGGDCCPSCSA